MPTKNPKDLSKDQKSQIMEMAQAYAAQGKLAKAIEAWEKLLLDNPQNGNIHNNIADIYARLNEPAKAVAACLKAAEAYRETGFEMKGVAVLKKGIKIDPGRIDIYEKLADIHLERGLTGSAMDLYWQTAKLYLQRNNSTAAIAVYKKLATLSPEDPAIPTAIAQIYHRNEQNKEAILFYEQAEAIYENKKMLLEARQVVDEIMKINPNYLTNLAKKQASLAALNESLGPREMGTPAAPAMESEESTLLRTGGAEFFSDIAPFPSPSPLVATPVAEQPPVGADIPLPPTAPPEAPWASEPFPFAGPPVATSQKPSTAWQPTATKSFTDVSEVIFQAHLAEADVYCRHGLNQNAIEKLLLAIELVPTREEPYLQLRELYLREGKQEKAAQIDLTLARLRLDLPEEAPSPLAEKKTIETPPVVFPVEGALGERNEEYVDIAAALKEELNDLSSVSLNVVQEDSARTPDPTESLVRDETRRHYLESRLHLGMAHKAMGNISKAVREFEQALSGMRREDGNRLSEVLTLLVQCYVEEGRTREAVDLLQYGTNDLRFQGPARLAVQYELASLYEQLGTPEQALPVYRAIYRVDPFFKDVSKKLREKASPPPAMESVPLTPQPSAPWMPESQPAMVETVPAAAPAARRTLRVAYV